MALIHYVCNLKDNHGNLLPIEQRGRGDVHQLLANRSISDINCLLVTLPPALRLRPSPGKNSRLPVLVNFSWMNCNVDCMEGIADSLNSIRSFNMSCQVVAQSLSQQKICLLMTFPI